MLLKYSGLIDQISKFNKENPENQISGDVFKLSSVIQLSAEQLDATFNGIAELGNVDEKVTFTPGELGEIQNMFFRLNELGNVNIFYREFRLSTSFLKR